MLTTEARMQKLLCAPSKVLARIDAILSGEDLTSGKAEADVSTITLTEAAKRLRVSRPTCYRLLQNNRIKSVRLNGGRGQRVLVASLVDFVNGCGK